MNDVEKKWRAFLADIAAELRALPPARVFQALTKEPYYVFSDMDTLEGVAVAERFRSGEDLFAALTAKDPRVLFGVPEMLFRSAPDALGPFIARGEALPEHDPADSFLDAASGAYNRARDAFLTRAPLGTLLSIGKSIGHLSPDAMDSLLDRPDLASPEARVALVRELERVPLDDSMLSTLRERIVDALILKARKAITPVLRDLWKTPGHPLQAWARQKLEDFDPETQREVAGWLDEEGLSKERLPIAINAAFALGADAAAEKLVGRFFSDAAVATKAGAELAGSVMHRAFEEVSLHKRFPRDHRAWIEVAARFAAHRTIGPMARDLLDAMDKRAVKAVAAGLGGAGKGDAAKRAAGEKTTAAGKTAAAAKSKPRPAAKESKRR